jgi:LysR family glycine cleavage system transcriptional activator
MLKNRLPPLEPLVAFESASRLLSFTRAGEELHLTQAAVSQQIRNLEQYLDIKLFTRSHRAVQLTDEGREYQHTVAGLLKQLASATTDIKSSEVNPRLSITCDQSFAALWLSSRLRQFQQVNPGISLRIFVSDVEAECITNDAQISIFHGEGYWPGFQSFKLFDEAVFPVCSPEYFQSQAELNWRDWLLQADLLDLDDSHWNWMNWRTWFAGQDIDEPLQFRNLQINSYPLLIEAACHSQGVALGWNYLVDELLDSGKLVRPIDLSLTTSFAYYLIINERYCEEPSVVQFRQWLMATFAASSQA